MGTESSRDDTPTSDEWNRIDQIFQEVVELDEDQRGDRLTELTGGDSQLRAEVESLISHDQASDKLPALRPVQDIVARPSRLAGSVVNRYRLLFPVAINRTSEVWCAEAADAAPSDESTRVAIKFLRDEANTARRLERFRNEAVLLSRFRHPNVAEFIDCGQDEDGVPYIVMRYVSGTAITEFADRKNLTIEERLVLMIHVCDAVSYAHRFLVVHRDLKPSNILVTSQQQPVILDFGISKSLGDDADTEASLAQSSLTTTGERPMTPAYASPEQVHGDPITTATDLYALGLILYELMCGHHPYSDEAHGEEEKLFDRVCHSLPMKPSQMAGVTSRGFNAEKEVPHEPRMIAALRRVSSKQLRRRLRDGVDSVTLRAIAKSPSKRYASISDFRNDLRNLVERRPVTAKVTDDRVRSWIRRYPLPSVGVAALLTAAMVTGIAFQLMMNQHQAFLDERGRADAKFKQEQANSVSLVKSLDEFEQEAIEDSVREAKARSAVLYGNTKHAPQQQPLGYGEASSPLAMHGFIARSLAERGAYDAAAEYLSVHIDGPDEDFSVDDVQTLIDFAATHQSMGNASRGLSFLPTLVDLQKDGGRQDLRGFAPVKLQLLLDARRTIEAERLVEAASDNAFESAAGMLALAEYRDKIGWDQGATELLDRLQDQATELGLSSDERLKLKLLRADVTDDFEELERLTNSKTNRPIPLAVRGRAFFLLARKEAEQSGRQEVETVVGRYQKVIDNFSDELPDHFLVHQAMYEIVAFADKHDVKDEFDKRGRRLWARLCQANELGTITAAWCGVSMMRNFSNEERAEVFRLFGPYAHTFSEHDYVQRQLLAYESDVAVDNEDWKRAGELFGELCPLENRLWGTDSMEHAYALAALANVRQHGSADSLDGEKLEKQAREIIRKIHGSLPNSRSLAFLQPVLNPSSLDKSKGRKPDCEWIDLYLMHRFNPESEQVAMLKYVRDELRQTEPESADLLDALIQ